MCLAHKPTEDVLVPHQDRLVDLRLPEPAGFLSGEEDFNGDLLSPPAAQPHLAVPPLSYLTYHLDLLGDGPLHLRTQKGSFRRALRVSRSLTWSVTFDPF